jgi:hypothetical protein
MTLTSGGDLGIGTTSPSQRVTVQSVGSSTAPQLKLQNPIDSNSSQGAANSLSAGQLLFGATGSYPLTAKIESLYNADASFGRSANLVFSNAAGDGTLAERCRIDVSGNLLVGQTSLDQNVVGFSVTPSGIVSTAMAASTSSLNSYHLYSTGAGAYRFYVGLGGTINATNTAITGISDQRLKENIRDLDDGLNVVMALKPRKFDWKEGKGANIKNARGFIAQEFEQVLPDMIEEWLDPAPEGEAPYKAVNANLIPTLVKALQEQQAIIESLKARLDAANL